MSLTMLWGTQGVLPSIFMCWRHHWLTRLTMCTLGLCIVNAHWCRNCDRFCTILRIHNSGGSRIFPRGCANSQNCYYFSNFCWKLHENERIWTPGGGRASLAPPLDPPMHNKNNFQQQNANFSCLLLEIFRHFGKSVMKILPMLCFCENFSFCLWKIN